MPAQGIPAGITAILTGGTAANQGLITISTKGTYLVFMGVAVEGADQDAPIPPGPTTYSSEGVVALRMGTSINTLTPIAGGYVMSRGISNPLNFTSNQFAGDDNLPEDQLFTTTFIINIPTVPMLLDMVNCNPSLMADGNNGVFQLDSDLDLLAPPAFVTFVQIAPQ